MATTLDCESSKRAVHVSPKQETCTPTPRQERGCSKAQWSKQRETSNGWRKRESKPLYVKGQDPLTAWMKRRLYAWMPLDKAIWVGELILCTAR
jgi:hypothetical protein